MNNIIEMSCEIYVNKNMKIVNNKNICQIEFTYPNVSIINSLLKTKIIQGGTSTKDYKLIKFKVYSVTTLNQFIMFQKSVTKTTKLSVNFVGQLCYYLSRQLYYLESNELVTFLGYNPEYVLVINEQIFIYLGCDLLSKINEDETIMVSSPFKKTDFLVSPELFNIREIPSYIHYKSVYFSFAMLLLQCLIPLEEDIYLNYLDYLDKEKKDKEINKEKINKEEGECFEERKNMYSIMEEYLNSLSIKDTKLYWLLSRCFLKDPNERSILFI